VLSNLDHSFALLIPRERQHYCVQKDTPHDEAIKHFMVGYLDAHAAEAICLRVRLDEFHWLCSVAE
jgi:hypothetical protein